MSFVDLCIDLTSLPNNGRLNRPAGQWNGNLVLEKVRLLSHLT